MQGIFSDIITDTPAIFLRPSSTSSLPAMVINHAIISNAQHHSDLVHTFDSLEYAPGTLKKLLMHIKHLQGEVGETKQRLEEMRKITKGKRREYTQMRSSTVRRMASSFAGRKEQFLSRVQREESEYVEALEAEMQERTRLETLEDTITEAEQAKIDLERTVDLFQTIQAELRTLYSRVFGQPTTSAGIFPKNDKALEHLNTAQGTCKSLQEQIEANEEATRLLKEADNLVEWSLSYIDEGLRCYDDWGMYGNGVLVEMERQFNKATQAISQVNSLLSQARKIEPVVQSMPPLKVYDPCIVGDIVVKYGVKMCNSAAKVRLNKETITAAHETIKSEILSANHRNGQLKADLEEAEEVMRDTEGELDNVRREIWEQVVRDEVARESGTESKVARSPEDPVATQEVVVGPKSRPPAYESLASSKDGSTKGRSSDRAQLSSRHTHPGLSRKQSTTWNSLLGHRFDVHNMMKFYVGKA
ncbi:hypothetical protein D9758_006558 [Tetrapyrgos nigripes]|uniref:Uncharacterized protein n=1 Tax=Tetrapyrgos nigripes TaxID=182062 RepID=A0A8H5LRK3_9AGAR|nr:hypothetical protein D9758_006558 [Tetrapyrgos nigripes]